VSAGWLDRIVLGAKQLKQMSAEAQTNSMASLTGAEENLRNDASAVNGVLYI